MKPYIDTELDSVIIFKSRQEKWLDKEFWGKEDKTSFSFKPLKYRLCDKAQEEIRNWNGIYNGLCTMDCNQVKH